MNIQKAQLENIKEIKTLSDQYEFDKLSQSERDKYGFLVSNFSEKEYLSFLSSTDLFFVILDEDVIAGFVLGYYSAYLALEDLVKVETLKRIEEPFAVIKQICVDKKHSGKGIAKQLYNYFYSKVGNMPIIAAIVTTPENPGSTAFHKKMGFESFYRFIPSDGKQRLMWIKK